MNFSLLAAHTAGQFLSNIWIIFAMICLVFGVALCCLAKQVALTKNPGTEDYKSTKSFKVTLLIGLILISVGLLLVIIGTALMTQLWV